MRFLIALFLAATAAAAQSVQYSTVKEEVLQYRLKLAHPKNSERYVRLKSLLAESGCQGDAYREQAVKGSKEPNLICSVAGTGEQRRKIIVGAHFDAVGGDGIVDNWSGAVLLPGLYDFLSHGQRRHDFEFVAFAAEEKGLWGSQAYLKAIGKEERRRIAAVVTMDSLGLTPTKCWTNGSTRELIIAASRVAEALRLDFRGVNVDGVGTTDSETFRHAGIPVLSLHSVTQATWGLINNKHDVWAAVSWRDYCDSYQLISALLAYLDQTLP